MLPRRTVVFAGGVGLLIACWASPLSAQQTAPDRAEQAAKALVVRVDGDAEFGSGIIVGGDAAALYVATANHVVRRGAREAQKIQVRFFGRTEGPVSASLLPERDDSLDLAVLRVERRNLPVPVAAIPFDRLGQPDALERGDPIFLLGHPNGLPWRLNASPEKFTARRDRSLEFESNVIAVGHSGGALLNGELRVVGLIKSDRAPYAEALDIYTVANTIAGWGYAVELRLPAPRVAAGEGRSCLLSSRGAVSCWGLDPRYEVRAPEVPQVNVQALSTGSGHVCGLLPGGSAFCVGSNNYGQLGDGTTESRYGEAAVVEGGRVFSSAPSAGFGHSCAVANSGDVFCWGVGSAGQLGGGESEGSPKPLRVPSSERFVDVGAGTFYSCGLSRQGRLYCWGSVAGVQQLSGSPVRPYAPAISFASIATGTNHVCGLTANGRAHCFGFNDDGQLGNGSTSEAFTDQPVLVAGGLTFASLSAGVGHTCGLTADGTAYCWGLNNFGQLGTGSKNDSRAPTRVAGDLRFTSLSAGALHTCGISTTGDVLCWGRNANGEVGSATAEELRPWRVKTVPEEERYPWRGTPR